MDAQLREVSIRQRRARRLNDCRADAVAQCHGIREREPARKPQQNGSGVRIACADGVHHMLCGIARHGEQRAVHG